MPRPTIIIMGSAGSGKGTQAELLEEQLGYHIMEAGAIFRAKAKEDTPLGKKVKEIHDSGAHASDELITELLADYLKSLPSKDHLLIDGYPRTSGQAELLSDLLRDSGRDPELYVAVWIQVSREEAERRLLNRSQCTVCKTVFMKRDLKRCPHCNGEVKPRDYDQPEAIAKRLDFFENKTMAAIEKYKNEKRLITVDGEREVADVFGEIKKQLKPFMEDAE